MNKKILICGAGCIGIYLGVLLSAKGNQVFLFGRRKLKETQDSIIINNKKYQMPEKIFKIPKNEKFDFVITTSKLYDLKKMINIINKSGIKTKFLASIQNGLVDNSQFKKILHHKLVPVTVFSGLRFENNGIVERKTDLGWKTENSKEGKAISKLISETGINCKSEKRFDSFRAEKTIINCTLNVLSAIENKKFSQLFENKRIRERIENLFCECYNILKNEHELDSSEKIKQRLIKNWSKMKHFSSTWQDLKSGRKLESEFFNGYIIKLGKKYNISAEENKKLMQELRKK